VTPTIKLDRVYRPITVPDHFIAYRVELDDTKLKAKVTFLRLKRSDGEPSAYLREQNRLNKATPWAATHANLSFAHTMTLCPENASNTFDVEYERKDEKSLWVRLDEPRLTAMIRQFADRWLADSDRS